MFITYQATLLEKKQIAPEIFLFKFSYPENADWNFKAGQYMIFHIPQGETHAARRLYSIASPPSQTDSLEFVIEMVPNGIGSMFLATMNVGEQVTIQGPAGMFMIKPTARHKIFLATGTGIAPMHSMIRTLIEEKNTSDLHLFWGMKKCEDMYYVDELSQLTMDHKNLKTYLCFSREPSMDSIKENIREYASLGRVTNGFETLVAQLQSENQKPLPELLNSFDYYICGGQAVVESLRQYLAEKGITKENVMFEKFTAGA